MSLRKLENFHQENNKKKISRSEREVQKNNNKFV